MNSEPVLLFIKHLEAVAQGLSTPKSVQAQFAPQKEDGLCLYNLYNEFVTAFSFEPGCVDVLPLMLKLARKASLYDHDDALRLFAEPEWQQLVQMRGPVEGMALNTCTNCHKEYPTFYISGFIDEFAAICGKCGNVLFESTYYERPLPECECGGLYRRQQDWCPGCGSARSRQVRKSSYDYFAVHSWMRRT